MDKSKMRRIVNKHVEQLRWALQLQTWKIDIEYCVLEGDSVASCLTNAPYHQMTIEIDCDKLDDKDEVLRFLRHEMLHGLHAEWDDLFVHVMECVSNKGQRAVLSNLRHQAAERLVGRLERMLDHGLKLDVHKMMEMSRDTRH